MSSAAPDDAWLCSADEAPCLDLRRVLKVGLWAALGRQERSALRLSCMEARQTADALIDTAVLSLSDVFFGEQPRAASVASVHCKLGIQTLRVRCNPMKAVFKPPSVEYAAAAGAGRCRCRCSRWSGSISLQLLYASRPGSAPPSVYGATVCSAQAATSAPCMGGRPSVYGPAAACCYASMQGPAFLSSGMYSLGF